MNQQPYQTPPRWWSPQLSPNWMRFWRRWRQRRGYREHALCEIEVRGVDHVERALEGEGGVLITPNHPSHADPFVLLEAADQIQTPFYFMTAWQVFATHGVGRRVLRQHGCFSINREGNDVRAVRQAVQILQHKNAPLVIFPEGEVFHLNDHVTPFRRGAVQSATWAAKRSGQAVSIIPCGIKLQYISDPTAALHDKLSELERHVGFPSRGRQPLVRRVREFGDFLLSRTESEVLGQTRVGPMRARVASLIETILSDLEGQYRLVRWDRSPPERIKRLRHQVIQRLESESEQGSTSSSDASEESRQLERLFLATQLFSYRIDYLAGDPPIERLAETVEKLEEDVLGVGQAKPAARRRAIVAFGQPMMIEAADAGRHNVQRHTQQIRGRVQNIVDGLSDCSPRSLGRGHTSDEAIFSPAA